MPSGGAPLALDLGIVLGHDRHDTPGAAGQTAVIRRALPEAPDVARDPGLAGGAVGKRGAPDQRSVAEDPDRRLPGRVHPGAHSASRYSIATSVKVASPFGRRTDTSSPVRLPISARPTGDSTLIRPCAASNSSGPTIW